MSAPRFPAVIAAVTDALASDCGVPDGTHIAAACSGGADSVALVAALAAVSSRWPLVAVIFVDHGLRDVRAEASAAREAAENAGVPFIERTLPAGSLVGNLQGAARVARYRTLLAAAPATALIATGHTADDQTETLLQRITRGTGLHGFTCIHPRNGRIIRPLLSVPRTITRDLGLHFADDPTNNTPKYLRNRLRSTVIPHLLDENPRLHDAVAQVRNAAAGSLQLIDFLLDDIITRDATATPRSLPPLGSMPHDARSVWLRHLIGRVAPGLPPTGESLLALNDAITRNAGSFGVNLGNGWRATWRDGHLEVSADRDLRRTASLAGPGAAALAGLVVIVDHVEQPPDSTDAPFVWPVYIAPNQSWPEDDHERTRPDAQPCDRDDLSMHVEIRDANTKLIWPDRPCVSTVRKLASPEGVFRFHIRRQPTLTVESNGHIRLSSHD